MPLVYLGFKPFPSSTGVYMYVHSFPHPNLNTSLYPGSCDYTSTQEVRTIPRSLILTGDEVTEIHLLFLNELTICNFLNFRSHRVRSQTQFPHIYFFAESLYTTTVVLDGGKASER